jgi:hypothetical protein
MGAIILTKIASENLTIQISRRRLRQRVAQRSNLKDIMQKWSVLIYLFILMKVSTGV